MVDTKTKAIYLADDEPELLALLREALEDAGYDVRTCADGASLLRLVEERVPDAVLLDIHMPGMSGWEVRRRLLERAPSLPVIAVTAHGGPSVEASALRTLRFADFVRKPFRLAELLARLERVMDAPAAPRGADEPGVAQES